MFKTPTVPSKRKPSEEKRGAAAAEADQCSECGKLCAAYRCPGCRARYCSVGCCQVHKEHCSPDPDIPDTATAGGGDLVVEGQQPPPSKRQRLQFEFPTEDTLAQEVIEKMEGDPKLQLLLKSPALRGWITKVDSSMNPKASVTEAMQNDEFRKFANQVLRLAQVDKNYFQIEESDSE